MDLIHAERLEPKRAFRCVMCDPPPKKPRVLRRYLFTFEADEQSERSSGDYCLPCAAEITGKSQYRLRKAVGSGESIA